jgi:hypothetical protein
MNPIAPPLASAILSGGNPWPPLPLEAWRETYATLHLWTQMVGKTRLALAPMRNHWWQVALYVTSRGLSTSPMPYQGRTVEIEFDFLKHRLVARDSEGAEHAIPLEPRSVASFYRHYQDLLRSMHLQVPIHPMPVEIADPIPFDDDFVHEAYDPVAASACWRVLVQVDRVLKQFQGRFLGKCSPVNFWWGGFDLACTRFSGRAAPPHPGGIPNTPDYVTREGYSHECISAGWWPGGGLLEEAAFYAYIYPAQPDLAGAAVLPGEAFYHPELGEFILPYEAVRTASRPDEVLLDFLQSTYAAAAELAGWDRAALERPAR